MTSWAVIDSGILLATVLTEQNSKEAKALLKVLTEQPSVGNLGQRFSHPYSAKRAAHLYNLPIL
jgi:hypothetical protein